MSGRPTTREVADWAQELEAVADRIGPHFARSESRRRRSGRVAGRSPLQCARAPLKNRAEPLGRVGLSVANHQGNTRWPFARQRTPARPSNPVSGWCPSSVL